ncbi:MAG: hypothetical protein MZW92_03985 [Comamonadaceae bacterium]|nr:hypothetical protein [Comamonadaceae bacterium]
MWIGEAIVDALNDDGYLDRVRWPTSRAACSADLPVTDGGRRAGAALGADARPDRRRRARRERVHLPAARAARRGNRRAASSRSPSRATTCRRSPTSDLAAAAPQLRGGRGHAAGRAGADPLAATRARARRSRARSPSTSCRTCSCAAPTRAGRSRSTPPPCRASR